MKRPKIFGSCRSALCLSSNVHDVHFPLFIFSLFLMYWVGGKGLTLEEKKEKDEREKTFSSISSILIELEISKVADWPCRQQARVFTACGLHANFPTSACKIVFFSQLNHNKLPGFTCKKPKKMLDPTFFCESQSTYFWCWVVSMNPQEWESHKKVDRWLYGVV